MRVGALTEAGWSAGHIVLIFKGLVRRVQAPIMAKAMRRANRKDLKRIKKILESQSQPTC